MARSPQVVGGSATWLTRTCLEVVRRHLPERLHERGLTDREPAYLGVFLYMGPQGARPSELAARPKISKQA